MISENVHGKLNKYLNDFYIICEHKNLISHIPKRKASTSQLVEGLWSWLKEKISSYFSPFGEFFNQIEAEGADEIEAEKTGDAEAKAKQLENKADRFQNLVNILEKKLGNLDKWIIKSKFLVNAVLYGLTKLLSGFLQIIKELYHTMAVTGVVGGFFGALWMGPGILPMAAFLALMAGIVFVVAIIEKWIEKATKKRIGIHNSYMRIPNLISKLQKYLSNLEKDVQHIKDKVSAQALDATEADPANKEEAVNLKRKLMITMKELDKVQEELKVDQEQSGKNGKSGLEKFIDNVLIGGKYGISPDATRKKPSWIGRLLNTTVEPLQSKKQQ